MNNPFEELEARLNRIESLILNMSKAAPAPVPAPEPDEISIDGAERITGLKKSTLYKASFEGTIPVKKRGRRLIFSRKDLQSWLNSNTIEKRSPESEAAEQLAREVFNRRKRK